MYTHTQHFHMVGHHTMRIIMRKVIHGAKSEIYWKYTEIHMETCWHIYFPVELQ